MDKNKYLANVFNYQVGFLSSEKERSSRVLEDLKKQLQNEQQNHEQLSQLLEFAKSELEKYNASQDQET